MVTKPRKKVSRSQILKSNKKEAVASSSVGTDSSAAAFQNMRKKTVKDASQKRKLEASAGALESDIPVKKQKKQGKIVDGKDSKSRKDSLKPVPLEMKTEFDALLARVSERMCSLYGTKIIVQNHSRIKSISQRNYALWFCLCHLRRNGSASWMTTFTSIFNRYCLTIHLPSRNLSADS